jgi:cobalt/nickel transport system permease protein
LHIPDGFLSPTVTTATLAVSGMALAANVKALNRDIKAEQIPLMGVLASFVFLVQLFSFPLLGGTSIHLTGALLISIILGPRAGYIIMSASLIVLALLFQHGGILSLGANILNMGIIGCFVGWGVYQLIPGQGISIVLASIAASVLAAFLAAVELASSDMFVFSTGLKSMLIIYSITGLIEGVITVSIIGFIKRIKPEIMELGS